MSETVDYDGFIAALREHARKKNVNPDPASYMRVAARKLKEAGYNVTAADMDGLSQAARRAAGLAPSTTADTGPSVTGYLESFWDTYKPLVRGVADTGRIVGKTANLGINAGVSSILSKDMDQDWREAAAAQIQNQARDLSATQEQAGIVPSIVGGIVTFPLLPFSATAQKAVAMQDEGKDLRTPANQANLAGTAALQAGLNVAGAGAAGGTLSALAGGSNLGLTGVRGALAGIGTGAVAGAGATGAQAGIDYATGNESQAPGLVDYAINTGAGALLPAGAALGRVPAALRERRINLDQIAAQAPAMDAPVDRGADPIPAPADNGVIAAADRVKALDEAYGTRSATEVPGAEVKQTLSESYTPQELKTLFGKKLKDVGKNPVEVATPASAGSLVESQRIVARTNYALLSSLVAEARRKKLDDAAEASVQRARDEWAQVALKARQTEEAARDKVAYEQLIAEDAASRIGLPVADTVANIRAMQATDRTQGGNTAASAASNLSRVAKSRELYGDSQSIDYSPILDRQPSTVLKETMPVQEPSVEPAPAAAVPENTPDITPDLPAPEPRYYVEPATGKARLVTDRMSVDPKDTVSYADLTPEQKNRVDVAARNLSRKTAGRNVTRTGATINPVDVAVETYKGTAKRAKALAKVIHGGVGDATGTQRAVRSLLEVVGADKQDRLAKSSNPVLRKAGDQLGRANEEQYASRQRMAADWEQAKKLAAGSSFEREATRKADGPIKPVNPDQKYASSPLLNAIEGKGPVPLGTQRVKDAFTLTAKATRREAEANGLKVVEGTGDDVFVRHKAAPFYAGIAQGPDSPFGKVFIPVMMELNGRTEAQVLKDFYGVEKGSAVIAPKVDLDAIELRRRYKNFPQYIRNESGDGWVRLLETDPARYVDQTFNGMARRVGFHKGFEGATSSQDLVRVFPGLDRASDAEKKTVIDAIAAYNNHLESPLDASASQVVSSIRNVRQVYAALKVSAAAPVNLTEIFNLGMHVPFGHAAAGTINAIKHRGRAVAEGGLEADVPNRLDLRSQGAGKLSQKAGNVRGFLARVTGNNAINRATHAAGYEAGRSWASAIKDAGSVTAGDTFFMNIARVSEKMQERFKNGTATDEDVKVLATMIGENSSGNKRNLAQQGSLNRNAYIALLGPLYRRYGENRVRNLLRVADAAAKHFAKDGTTYKEDAAVLARLAQAVTATGVSAGAATAVAGAMAYGLVGAGMYLTDTDQAVVPFVVNFLGGALTGSVLQQMTNDANPELMDVAKITVMPIGMGMDLYNNMSQGTPENIVPLVRRVNERVLGNANAGSGKVAYNQFRRVQKQIEGREGSGFTANPYRKALHDALLTQDQEALRSALREARQKMDAKQYKRFLQGTRLLPIENKEKLRRYRTELGDEVFKLISAHDDMLESVIP